MLCKQTGLYLRPLIITRIEKALQKQAISSADQNTFFIYWFLTKLQSIIINQIQNTFGGGLVSGRAFNWMHFLLTRGWACNSLGGS